MHSALRGAIGHVGRRLLFAAVAIGCVVAFISIARGTDAQTSQQVSIIPIETSASAPVPTTSAPPAPVVADTLSSAAPARHESSAAPVAAKTTAPAPPPVVATTAPSSGQSYWPWMKSNSSAAGSTAPAREFYRYVGSRDIASLINPAREANGWADVSNGTIKGDSSCLANQTCTGQVGTCGETPSSAGDASATRVYDGQYEDQFGDCREVIVV